MAHEFTDEDRDKPVRVVDGEQIGTVSDVREGRASVEENEGITDAIKEKIGWDDDSDGTHELSDAAVERVDDDGVWIRQI